MSDLQRQVDTLQWQLDALRADLAESRSADASIPSEGSTVLHSGVAQIDSVDGSGEYTVTEQWWNGTTSAWNNAVAPLGLVAQSSREFQKRLTGMVDQRVRFWQQRRKDGALETLIDLGGGVDFWALINGSVVSSGTNRWIYPWNEVEKTGSGYDDWTTLSGGRSGTTGSNPAYNTIEDMNSAAGEQGNGATIANIDTAEYTFTIRPCPNGVILRMFPVSYVISGAVYTEYWFSYVNGVDGTCD